MYVCTDMYTNTQLTEEIRLQILGSPDLSIFLMDLSSDRAWDSVDSREIFFEILGTPVTFCLKYTGTAVKTCLKICQS